MDSALKKKSQKDSNNKNTPMLYVFVRREESQGEEKLIYSSNLH